MLDFEENITDVTLERNVLKDTFISINIDEIVNCILDYKRDYSTISYEQFIALEKLNSKYGYKPLKILNYNDLSNLIVSAYNCSFDVSNLNNLIDVIVKIDFEILQETMIKSYIDKLLSEYKDTAKVIAILPYMIYVENKVQMFTYFKYRPIDDNLFNKKLSGFNDYLIGIVKCIQ